MALETGSYINDLVITNPVAADPKSQGDDHIRLIKSALKETLNGFTGAILVTATDTGSAAAHVLTPSTALVGYTPSLCLLYNPAVTNTGAVTVNVSGLGAKSIKTLTGNDPAPGDLVAGAPVLLVYNGTNFITLAGSEFVAKSGNQTVAGNMTFTGTTSLQAATGLTRTSGDNTTNLATTAFVTAVTSLLATLDSPAFTGTPTAPTATAGTSTNQLATTAFVTSTSFASVLPGQAGNAGKYITTNGSSASWGSISGPSTAETLTNKTITLATNSFSGTLAQFNTACTDADFASTASLTSAITTALTTAKDEALALAIAF